jgi:predicted nucleic acid-binding protein
MKVAYVDTSALIAVAFDEPGGRALSKLLSGFDRLVSSNLLEAEWRATLLRERVVGEDESLVAAVTWIIPNRPLSTEIARVLNAGYLRGADAWHLACALFLDPTGQDLSLVTLDADQAQVATTLGFGVVPRKRRVSRRRP